ncbi:MAG: AAA family ATPase [Thermoguttaceae bacterium]|jgi:type II secretory pathway predicted ATPase ExeA
MYEAYFNLGERPFASVPRTDHYFPAATIQGARGTLIRCVDRGEGAAILVGPPGTGKTLLCQILAEHFQGSFRVVLLGAGRLSTRRALLQAILHELGQPYRDMDEGELRLALTHHATLGEDCSRPVVLLADEAHDLPLRLLDEIRMLTNLVREGQPAVRPVLAGNRGLEERFASPRLESFNQRLAARCYLEAFQRAETEQYIHARIAAAGGLAPQIFPPETCQSVYKATDGVPRLINQVCDHVMLLASASGLRRIEPAHVEEAWADLQQLPAPQSDLPRGEEPAVIEFGGLEDEPEKDGSPGGAAAESGRGLLRISPESSRPDPSDSGPCEPAAELGRIQEILAEVDEEFKPAGSIKPEVEILLDEPDHPFRETFAEEEVVADRYAPAARGPSPATPHETAAVKLPTLQEEEEFVATADAGDGQPGRDLAGAAPCQPEPTPAFSPPLAVRQNDRMEQVEPEDAGAVVVEESDEDTPWPERTVAAVRRQQYGRLFANLRRSS